MVFALSLFLSFFWLFPTLCWCQLVTAKGTWLAKIICLLESRLRAPFSFSLICQLSGQQGLDQIRTQQSTSSVCSDVYWATLCTRCKGREESCVLVCKRLCPNRGKQTYKQPSLTQKRIAAMKTRRGKWLGTSRRWFHQSLPDYTAEKNFF